MILANLQLSGSNLLITACLDLPKLWTFPVPSYRPSLFLISFVSVVKLESLAIPDVFGLRDSSKIYPEPIILCAVVLSAPSAFPSTMWHEGD